jgi:hypothetical protein
MDDRVRGRLFPRLGRKWFDIQAQNVISMGDSKPIVSWEELTFDASRRLDFLPGRGYGNYKNSPHANQFERSAVGPARRMA